MSTQPLNLPPGATLESGGNPMRLPAGATLENRSAAPESLPGFWDTLQREGKSLAGTIAGMPAAVYHAFSEPETAEEATDRKKIEDAGGNVPDDLVTRGLNRLVASPVATAVKWYSDAAKGKIPNAYEQALSVAPEALGSAGGAMIGGKLTEGAVRGAVRAPEAVRAVAANVKPALAKTGAAATAIGESLDPDVVGLVSPRAAHALRLSARVGKVASKYGAEAADATAENAPYAGEEAPAEAPVPAPVKPVKPAEVERLLNESMGGRPLQPGVPLRNQAVATGAKLPEGFTPVKSSALRGYKYDPEAQEFESITTSGQHYIHGDVGPDQAQAFEAAESKGKAWNDLRQNATLVGKVVNGQRVAARPPVGMRSVVIDPETGQPEFSDVLAARQSRPAKAPEKAPSGPRNAAAAPLGEDLTALLQKSLEQVKNVPKGGVMTSADPGALAERWGVDTESLVSGREQTRGMTPDETEGYISKLAARYKAGEPPEPLMETRDADNNIVSVDGRARAIAAQRAGIKRIPIIVRRLAAQVE